MLQLLGLMHYIIDVGHIMLRNQGEFSLVEDRYNENTTKGRIRYPERNCEYLDASYLELLLFFSTHERDRRLDH